MGKMVTSATTLTDAQFAISSLTLMQRNAGRSWQDICNTYAEIQGATYSGADPAIKMLHQLYHQDPANALTMNMYMTDSVNSAGQGCYTIAPVTTAAATTTTAR